MAESCYDTNIMVTGVMEIAPNHYNDIKRQPRDFNSAATQLCVQLFVRAHIKVNIEAPHHWRFVIPS